MGGGIPKPAQSSEAVEHDSEGTKKDGSNGAGTERNVQGGGAVGAIIWQRVLGGDWGYDKGPSRVTSLFGATDHGDDGKTRGRRGVGVPSGRGGDGCRRAPSHKSVHKEAAENDRRESGLLPRLCTVHGGGADAGDEPDRALVGSRRGK